MPLARIIAHRLPFDGRRQSFPRPLRFCHRRPACTSTALLALALGALLGARCQDDVQPPEADANALLPSEETCYFSAMAEGCPGSLGVDAQRALCMCEYQDNTWFHVLTRFIRTFRTARTDRTLLPQKFGVQMQADGTLSLDVGMPDRIQCGEAVVGGYPGTSTAVNAMHLYQLAGNFIYPQVRNSLNELCLPGRLALQMICLHAELLRKNVRGAKAYASQMEVVYSMTKSCLHAETPWPFPGLKEYLLMWSRMDVETAERSPDAAESLAWWPDVQAMRGKLPEESSAHFWPCAELADPLCFPSASGNTHTSCENCCDPGKGPMGDADCFIGEWSFVRCCRTPGGSGRFY